MSKSSSTLEVSDESGFVSLSPVKSLAPINRSLSPVATTLCGTKFVANAGLQQFDQIRK